MPAPVDPPLKHHVWNWAGLLRQPQELPKLEEIAMPLPKGARDLGLADDGRPDEELLEYIRSLVRAHDRFRRENRERPITEWERWQEWDAVNRRYVEQFFLMLRRLKRDDNISMDRDNLILDAAGAPLVVSASLFQDASGDWKVLKRERWRYMHFMAAALLDPDEIWLSIDPVSVRIFKPEEEKMQVGGRAVLDRRYLRYFPNVGIFAAYEWNYRSWEGQTIFPPSRKGMNERRQGVLLYRREKN